MPPPLNDVFENFDEAASMENDADPHVHCDATFARHLTTNYRDNEDYTCTLHY